MNDELMTMVLNWTSRAEEVEALKCLVCFEVMKNPQRVPCGHSFCQGCLGLLDNVCLECGQPFQKKLVSKDILAFNLIEELTLKCDYGGCDWSGCYMDFKNHYKREHLKSPTRLLTDSSEGQIEENFLKRRKTTSKPARGSSASRRLTTESAPPERTTVPQQQEENVQSQHGA